MRNLAVGFQSLPTEYQNIIRLAQDRNQITVTPLQALTGGWSGAMVFLVSVASQNPDRIEHLVLKLDRKNEKSQSDETRRHEAAIQQSPPGFAGQHMAKMMFDCVEADGVIAIFYSIAGQSLYRFKTLSAYENQNQVEAIFASSYQYVLNDWNASHIFDQAVHPTALLEQWLGFRLKPGGHIENFLEAVCHTQPDMAGYLVQGRMLPNPLAYAQYPEWWGTVRPIDAAIGLQHGDLNTNNILTRFARNGEALDGYYLIDFALFKEKMPLLFDLRYLEMSYLILRQAQVSFTKLVDLIIRMSETDIVDPQQVPIDVAGICAVIGSTRHVFAHWVDDHYPSLHDDLWGQYWLAGVAAGLNYCHKPKLNPEARLAGFLYAAANLKRYAELFGLPAPAEARQLYDPTQLSQDRSSTFTARHAPHNLPAQVTTFIGRETEAAAIQQLLTSDDARLVTLTGPGGVGKTRLSLEVAARIRDSLPDGVFFVPLADITDPALVISKIAQTLGVREGSQSLIETVKSFLREKHMLLILDNFEQLMAAASVVADLLAASPRLKILVSSRVVLQLRGEQEFAVPPLETPSLTQLPGLEQLGESQSVRLFVERAQAANSRFTLTTENAAAVAEICQRLDGLPLAIELAAARIKLLSPQAILSRLDNRLTLLTGGARDLPLRQQSLRNSLDLSYSLLRPEEQTLFARLGVFVGGFTLETAGAVCNMDGGIDLLEGISSLMNNSFLRSEEDASGQPRFRMLETIREYALERLEQHAELAATQQAHAHYYFNKIANEMGNKIYTRDSLKWLNWLESEHTNIGAALAWGLSTLTHADLIPLIVLQLTWYWYRRGYLNEGRTWSDRVLNSPLAAEQTLQHAWALQSNAMLTIWQGNLLTAFARAKAGLESAQQLEEPTAVSMALLILAVVNINMGNESDAILPLKEAEKLFQEEGNPFYYPVALVHLGNSALGMGNPVEARAWLDQAYAISRDLGEGWVHSFVLNNLGEVARVQGDYDAARRCYEESESLLRTMGDKGDLARLIHNLGYIAQHEGNMEKAKAQFNESLTMFRVLGNKRGIAECLAALAGLEAVQGQATLAAQLLGTAEAIMMENGAGWWPADRGEIERTRSTIKSRLGDEAFEEALAAGRKMTLEHTIESIPN
ncbi:MAG: tetratricopeptide repeat protein [Anaerolineae bacterium]|nr:tetratricopeptide repeat protein [Anaerolineae bacterium]